MRLFPLCVRPRRMPRRRGGGGKRHRQRNQTTKADGGAASVIGKMPLGETRRRRNLSLHDLFSFPKFLLSAPSAFSVLPLAISITEAERKEEEEEEEAAKRRGKKEGRKGKAKRKKKLFQRPRLFLLPSLAQNGVGRKREEGTSLLRYSGKGETPEQRGSY